MTTFSVMVALLPIASGLEEGSELLQAAAVVLIGGLLTSTLLTLVFVPAMFTIFDDLQHLVLRLVRRDYKAQAPKPAIPSHSPGVASSDGRLAENGRVPAPQDGRAPAHADDRDGRAADARRPKPGALAAPRR
jgi:hypothetical protein